MNELTTGWKLFRLSCIIQMILVVLQLIGAVSGLFRPNFLLYSLSGTIVYILMFLFLFQGLSLINYNYPETPLSPRQKRNFNWLYLLNFLGIAYLFAVMVSEIKLTFPLITQLDTDLLNLILFGFSFAVATISFVFHLVFLAGMYKLRRLIYHNTEETWQDQFSDTKTS
jgi:hypothetical protein